jgi:acetyl-CoA C-acetyltransferase
VNRVAISTAATSKFTKATERSIFDIACEPCVEVLNNHGDKNIDALLFSSCSEEQYGSAIISEMLGIKPKISQRIDNLCNSGTNAVTTAYSLIASGLCDSALVVGAEKTQSKGNRLIWDVTRGSFNFPVHWASMFAKSHMRAFGTTDEQMALVSVKNHKNASKNDCALFQKPVTLNEVMASKMIAEPIKLLDCSAPCDGASAVLLLSEQRAKKAKNPIWIRGLGQQTSGASFANMDSMTTIETAKTAARDAFEMANVKPSQVDVAEIHDAFTILEIMAYEDLGFAQKGKGGKFIEHLQEEIMINPRGGLLGCGHPVGATGVAQVAEIALQLSGKAAERQISGCTIGLVHNLAAAGSSASVMILGN